SLCCCIHSPPKPPPPSSRFCTNETRQDGRSPRCLHAFQVLPQRGGPRRGARWRRRRPVQLDDGPHHHQRPRRPQVGAPGPHRHGGHDRRRARRGVARQHPQPLQRARRRRRHQHLPQQGVGRPPPLTPSRARGPAPPFRGWGARGRRALPFRSGPDPLLLYRLRHTSAAPA
ncbi:MAG: hypothetical protein J3K34DRAFT_262975, partial [Monoraphidium minutum]